MNKMSAPFITFSLELGINPANRFPSYKGVSIWSRPIKSVGLVIFFALCTQVSRNNPKKVFFNAPAFK